MGSMDFWKALFAAILLAYSMPPASAGQIKGVVTDSVSGDPLEGVTVQVQGTSAQTVTDAQGAFSLAVATGMALVPAGPLVSDSRFSYDPTARMIQWHGTGPGEIVIHDLSGKVTNSNREGVPGQATYRIPDHLPDAAYMVRLSGTDFVQYGLLITIGSYSNLTFTDNRHQAEPAGQKREKAGAAAGAVTLVLAKTGYLVKEQAVADGDTNVKVKLVAPQYGLEPTYDNTAPRTALTNMTPLEALNAYGTVVIGKRITGGLDFSAPTYWQHVGPDPRGQTYTFVDCEIQGGVNIKTAVDHESGKGTLTPESQMVTLNLSYCRVAGGFGTAAGFKGVIDHCSFHSKSQWAVNDQYNPSVAAPGATYNVFQNCYFWAPYQTQPSHYEVVQSFTKITGLNVLNCTFEQQGGPLANSGITGIVNLALAPDNVFDHCFFLWDGSVPAYYAVYSAGNGAYRNCFIEGGTSYLYPGSQATFTNCRDYTTNQLLTLP